MFAVVRARLQMANHIRQLFAVRPETLRASRWNCALRDGRLIVIRPSAKEPADRVIMNCLLNSGQVPSWYSTYMAVREGWRTLIEANVNIPEECNIWNRILRAGSFWMDQD